jgi:uncharacterized OB-fold protein
MYIQPIHLDSGYYSNADRLLWKCMKCGKIYKSEQLFCIECNGRDFILNEQSSIT